MSRMIALSLMVVATGCAKPKTATEAAQAYDVQISNGFTGRGGVIVEGNHVLGNVGVVPSSGEAQLTYGATTLTLGLVRRNDIGYGLLLIADGKLAGAPIGDSGSLEPGAKLAVTTWDTSGKAVVQQPTLTGWRAHETRAYMEIDLTPPKGAEGAGVFGPDGRLVGLLAFSLSDKLSYVLPIEYLTTGAGALTATVLGAREPSATFVRRRAEAAPKRDPLRAPPRWDRLDVEQSYSRTALVGRIALLDKPGKGAAHNAPIRYRLEAIDQKRARRTLAAGSLPPAEQRWAPMPERKTAVAAAVTAQFGPGYAAQQISPYDYGELRYRIPFPLFCRDVSQNEVHALTLTLADGRHSDEIAFADLINICSAIEDGDGSAYEKSWGMGTGTSASAAPSKSAPPPKSAAPSKAKPKKKHGR